MSDDPKKPIDPNLEVEWSPPARTLDTDGNVSGPAPKRPDPQLAPPAPAMREGLPTLEALKTGDLELVRDPHQRREETYEEPVYRPVPIYSRKKPTIVMLVLVVMGIGGFIAFWKSPQLASAINNRTLKRGPLVISSDPSGAELWLAGKKVGTTPWASDNIYPPGKVQYELRARGFKPAKGTFLGVEEVHLDVAMEVEGSY